MYLETQRDGYSNSDHLLQQVEHTMDIFEQVHPEAQGLLLFDNAPSHKKLADDALNVDRMIVHPGGMQPAMRSTIWDGKVQVMVYPDGTPKEMEAVLEESGIDKKAHESSKHERKIKVM